MFLVLSFLGGRGWARDFGAGVAGARKGVSEVFRVIARARVVVQIAQVVVAPEGRTTRTSFGQVLCDSYISCKVVV